ncbi:DUF2225 domain-containing protein [Marinicrinis lubricantis]|uniref:DUF2225 domain-containing protein n=1 Tax=Marinicrinis lubricantis TaxID=2086470 RepID=A0ABW1IPP9_9BACL
MTEALYSVQAQCACCETPFQTSKVRPKFKKSKGRDSDFCLYYEEETLNPDFYVVRVCPACGFASTENFAYKFTDEQRNTLFEKISAKWNHADYSGRRSWEDAMVSYKLAILCAQITNQSERVLSGLLHHIAWLYRYRHDAEQEQRYLRFALDSYVKVYEQEGTSNDAKLMYMIGELNRRLKQYHEAVKWFGRVVNDEKIMDSAMIAASREQWALTRENMKEDEAAQSS